MYPSVCRVCLSSNREMKTIAHTILQPLFEKLTSNELILSDGRPEDLCYLCHMQLLKCWKFAEMSRRADIFLSGFFASGVQPTEKNLINNCSVLRHATSPVLSCTFNPTLISIPSEEEEESKKSVKIEVEEKKYHVMLNDPTNSTAQEFKHENKETKQFEISFDAIMEDYNSAPVNVPTKQHLNHTENSKQIEIQSNIIVNDSTSNKTDKPTFKCPKCPKTFRQKAYFKRHLRIHTGEKPYKCKLCEEAFTDSTFLKLHTRKHNGEAPYICQMCAKSFNHKPALVEHIRTHTGEKPHSCDQCCQSFAHKGSLKRHMRIHSGEKPYLCHICSRRFSQISNLRKHTRSCNVEKNKHLCVKCKHQDSADLG